MSSVQEILKYTLILNFTNFVVQYFVDKRRYRDTSTQLRSFEFCEIFEKHHFFIEHLCWLLLKYMGFISNICYGVLYRIYITSNIYYII